MQRYRIQIVLLLLCLRSLLNEAKSSTKPAFHKILSQAEIRRYLDTETQDADHDYDIVRISHQRSERSANPHHKHYRLSAFDKDFDLMLKPNDDVIPETGLVIERRTTDGLLTRDIHVPQGRFYVGHVASDPGSHVAVRETEKEGKLSGAILSDGHMYKIEPLSHDLHRRAALDGTGYHVISKRSVNNVFSTRKKSAPIAVPELNSIRKESIKMADPSKNDRQSKRGKQVYQGKTYIEAMLTADKTTCDFYGNDTRDYLLNSANLISRLYKDDSIGVDVSWTLVKMFLVEGVDPDLDITVNNITSASKYLGKFRGWAAKRNKRKGKAEHYDHSALVTRRICGLNHCYMNGLAYFNRPCHNKWGVSVNEARGLSVAFTVAHEMAHNLGVLHDTRTCAKGFIMQAHQSFGPNAFHWSPCSRARLQQVFTSNKCFHNKPPKHLPGPTVIPGYAIAIDEQCQMAFGPDYKGCFVGESCGALYCTASGSGCYSRGAPVSEGTVCGDRKWCRAGICTDVGSSLPPPIDGGWGPWGQYGSCTRTCGGGVMYRSRQCNNPAPQYFGKPCKGKDKAFFKLCNSKVCTSGHFRNEQCEEHNADYYSYGMGGALKCSLACVDKKDPVRAYHYGHVKDGTPCERNPHVYDVCIEGECHSVGCDKLLDSKKVYDRCLNCGGDGSSCVLRKGTYTKNYKVYGAYKGDTMFTISIGATNVKIVENSPSYNFISIKSNKTKRYYVPVPSWTNTYKAAGTSIYHYMKKYLDAELISIKGPTNEDLDAMYAYSKINSNPGISYEFYIPGKAASTTFYWKSKASGCSATCAGGTKLIKVTCHRQDDHSEVTPVYCDRKTKPAESEPCNLAPCPPQFRLGVWSPCSEQCGGGQQNRSLTCVQVVSHDNAKTVNESLCAQLKRPATSQKCNEIDCMAQWVVGEWTKCSVPCGDGGARNRSVECKQKLSNSSWAVLPANQCNDVVVNAIPPKTTHCDVMPACYAWRVEYPCVSCGGSDRTYAPVGCFQDNHNSGRPLPEMLSNYRNNINWHKMSATVKKCSEDAWNKKYPVFGVQFYGECWSGAQGYVTYDEDGFNIKGCWEGVGKTRNNYVYAFTSLVVEPITVRCIYTPSNQTVPDGKCAPAPRPPMKMKLCTDVCTT